MNLHIYFSYKKGFMSYEYILLPKEGYECWSEKIMLLSVINLKSSYVNQLVLTLWWTKAERYFHYHCNLDSKEKLDIVPLHL